jgi:hypothetical protein
MFAVFFCKCNGVLQDAPKRDSDEEVLSSDADDASDSSDSDGEELDSDSDACRLLDDEAEEASDDDAGDTRSNAAVATATKEPVRKGTSSKHVASSSFAVGMSRADTSSASTVTSVKLINIMPHSNHTTNNNKQPKALQRDKKARKHTRIVSDEDDDSITTSLVQTHSSSSTVHPRLDQPPTSLTSSAAVDLVSDSDHVETLTSSHKRKHSAENETYPHTHGCY